MKKAKILLIIFLVALISMIISSLGYAASGDIAEGDAPKDIPADFWGIWLVVKYEPKDTDIFEDNNGHILESAYIIIRAWQRRVHEGKVYVEHVTNYCPHIYVKDIGKIKVYDGKYGATDLVSGKEGKRFGDDARNWNGNELWISLASNYYKYASQEYAKINITPKPDPNWINYPPIKTNLDNLKEPRTLKIAQWVDYRAIVKRINLFSGDYEFKLVWKAHLYVKGEGFVEDYVMPGDTVICDGGADWFKKAIVDVFNSREYRAICDKVESVAISYEKGRRGAVTNIICRNIIFWIAQPKGWAKILRLDLPGVSCYKYYHPHFRTGIIRHEPTHCYHAWALGSILFVEGRYIHFSPVPKGVLNNGDNDLLPSDDKYLGTWVWRWQRDDLGLNGFRGDLIGQQDLPTWRPKAITKNIDLPIEVREYIKVQDYLDKILRIRQLIMENMPKEPMVGQGAVPNGSVWPYITVTFHYTLGGRPGEFTRDGDIFSLAHWLNGTVLGRNDIVLRSMDVTYSIFTPHHPDEYDCEEVAKAIYKGKTWCFLWNIFDVLF